MYEFGTLIYSETSLISAPFWEFQKKRYSQSIVEALSELQKDGWEVVCPTHDRSGYLMRRKIMD